MSFLICIWLLLLLLFIIIVVVFVVDNVRYFRAYEIAFEQRLIQVYHRMIMVMFLGDFIIIKIKPWLNTKSPPKNTTD